jgi:hypothetical protein
MTSTLKESPGGHIRTDDQIGTKEIDRLKQSRYSHDRQLLTIVT